MAHAVVAQGAGGGGEPRAAGPGGCSSDGNRRDIPTGGQSLAVAERRRGVVQRAPRRRRGVHERGGHAGIGWPTRCSREGRPRGAGQCRPYYEENVKEMGDLSLKKVSVVVVRVSYRLSGVSELLRGSLWPLEALRRQITPGRLRVAQESSQGLSRLWASHRQMGLGVRTIFALTFIIQITKYSKYLSVCENNF